MTLAQPLAEALHGWGRSRSRSKTVALRQRLVVVGNGMVGQRFCERLVELGGTERFDVLVLSEEPTPAYDRVHLGDYLRGRSASDLLLREPGWYEKNRIELRLKERVVEIDSSSRRVTTSGGGAIAYDKLVLATGSHAVLPPLLGSEGVEVIGYRTLEDAERVLVSVRDSHARDRLVVVLGGGLLGIEAARTFQLLGCRVVILETASQLLPRQLDPAAAAVLQAELERAGLQIRLRCRVERVERGNLLLLADGSGIEFGALVAAVGARASDEVARQAGLRCHLRGGVEVDSALQTSAADVFAIGECASHADVPHGLVAPGYAMADVLAANLTGQRRRLEAQDAVTRLKLDLTEVTVLGDPVRVSHDTDLVWTAEGSYRRLLVRGGRLVAAVCVGPWSELASLQALLRQKGKVKRSALARFQREGLLGLAAAPGQPERLPDSAVVCQCANVTCGALRAVLAAGSCDAPALSRATGAGTLCGSCQPVLVALSGGGSAPRESRWFLGAAAGALLLVFTAAALPRIPLATSVLEQGVDRLFVEASLKQVTGYGTLALVSLGLLFSLRKRSSRFRLSSYPKLRVWHGVLGAGALLGFCAHTGFRLGSNLNMALAALFLISAVTGALAALSARARHEHVRLASSSFRRIHEITFWPLPVLVLFHALKSYYF